MLPLDNYSIGGSYLTDGGKAFRAILHMYLNEPDTDQIANGEFNIDFDAILAENYPLPRLMSPYGYITRCNRTVTFSVFCAHSSTQKPRQHWEVEGKDVISEL
jgi:hypothetical protein